MREYEGWGIRGLNLVGSANERCRSLASRFSLNVPQADTLKEQQAILERKCNQLREENASLVEALSISKQDVELLKVQKEELLKNLSHERGKMNDLKEEIRLFSLAFAERECLLNSLYTKSKAMIENFSNKQIL